jgi:hypothetical protein
MWLGRRRTCTLTRFVMLTSRHSRLLPPSGMAVRTMTVCSACTCVPSHDARGNRTRIEVCLGTKQKRTSKRFRAAYKAESPLTDVPCRSHSALQSPNRLAQTNPAVIHPISGDIWQQCSELAEVVTSLRVQTHLAAIVQVASVQVLKAWHHASAVPPERLRKKSIAFSQDILYAKARRNC